MKITISSLGLDDTRESVASQLRPDDYRMFHPSEWKERWYRMDNSGIDVTYDESGSVHRIEAGLLEIDGIDASRWNVKQFEQVLGPAPLVGSSREVGKTDRRHLSYPQYRLLIYLEPDGNRFILFEPGF